jgi:trk system potassium uptake protein TrkA
MKILIIGCGRLGSELAQLMSLRNHTVTVVDKDPDTLARLRPSFKGQSLVGVGFDREVLLQAGIQRADALAAVTGSDEANAVIARLASRFFHVPRVVARLYDPRKAEIYRRLGLQTISPVAWGISRIAELLSFSTLNTTLSLGSGAVDVVETEIPPLLVGRAVHELTLPGEITVAAISRSGATFLPTLGTLFQEGDLAHLVVLASSMARLNDLLGLRG